MALVSELPDHTMFLFDKGVAPCIAEKPHDDKEQDNMGMEQNLALKPLACRGVASCLNKSDQGERLELFVLCADIGISCLRNRL